MTSGMMAKGRFGKQDFRYVAEEDIYKNVYNAFEFPEHRLFPQFAYL